MSHRTISRFEFDMALRDMNRPRKAKVLSFEEEIQMVTIQNVARRRRAQLSSPQEALSDRLLRSCQSAVVFIKTGVRVP